MKPSFRQFPLTWNHSILVCLMAVALAAASASASESTSAGDAALFDRLDANHNGVVDGEEVTPESRSLFDRLVRRGDANHDRSLSREEFLAALVPTRPDKPLEPKQPGGVPDANAVRYLLLKMDTNGNARIEKDEVPSDLKFAYEMMAERVDKNGNGGLDRQELDRAGPVLSMVASRYAQRAGIDVEAEMAKLEKAQGDEIYRFERQLGPPENLRDPKQARQMFARFDENADGKLDPKEVPEPLQEPINRLVRMGDQDNDGKLTEREFTTATERLGKFFRRGPGDQMPARESKFDRKAKGDDSKPGKDDVKGKGK